MEFIAYAIVAVVVVLFALGAVAVMRDSARKAREE
jgi:hypothetical protein